MRDRTASHAPLRVLPMACAMLALTSEVAYEALLFPRRVLPRAAYRAARDRSPVRARARRPQDAPHRRWRGLSDDQSEGIRAGASAQRRAPDRERGHLAVPSGSRTRAAARPTVR